MTRRTLVELVVAMAERVVRREKLDEADETAVLDEIAHELDVRVTERRTRALKAGTELFSGLLEFADHCDGLASGRILSTTISTPRKKDTDH